MNTEVSPEIFIEEDLSEKLKPQLRGELIKPGDSNYDSVRQVWNAMIDKHPAMIVRCKGVSDVIASLNFAKNHNIVVAVRGGGHNIAGSSTCDGGLLIDLSLMKSVRVDPLNQTARVEAGATLADFDHETQAFGLATPLGINSTTGIAGLTLGGGFGWLSKKYGLTIDNLLSADVVTADGKLLTASESENSDLFWAIRGGGGNFGIVTSFEFKLHKVGPDILSGLIIHPVNNAAEILKFYRDFIKQTPEEFVCWSVLRKAPPFPFLPAEWHGKEILGLAISYYGDIKDGEKIVEPLRKFRKPIADTLSLNKYELWQKALDASATPGMRNYWKSHYFYELSDGLIDTLVDFARKIPDPQTDIKLGKLGGAIKLIPKEDTAFTQRDAEYILGASARWDNPAKDEVCIRWTRELFEATTPYATGGVYVNFLNHEEQERVSSAYGINYERLISLKNKYDPTNVFRVNQNIKPTKGI